MPIVILSMPTTDHYVSSGGHQRYHISPGPANGKAVCWWWLPYRLPRGRSVSGWHWHQRRTGTDLLSGDWDTQCPEQSGTGVFNPSKPDKSSPSAVLGSCSFVQFSPLYPNIFSLCHPFILFHSPDPPGSTAGVPRCQIHAHPCCGRYMGERCSVWGAGSNGGAIK